MPLITGLALFLILGAIITLFTSEIVREGARGIGPQSNLLIPGLNPYLPIAEGWIALVLTIIVHEAGHGIVARVYGVKVESTGIVLFLGLPIGAFVNIERDELDKISIKQKSSIMTAGPMSNIILAGVSLFLMFLITSSLTISQPINPNIFGVSVTTINPNSLAESLGLTKGSTIQQIQNNEIRNPADLNENLGGNLGKTVSVTWLNENGEKVVKQATLPNVREPGKGILGVTVTEVSDPKKVLDRYNSLFVSNPLALLAPPTMAQGVIPFSSMMQEKYSSPIFGSFFSIPANLLFWLWFINFNVAIFNALPIGPLDGGQLYNAIINKKTEKRKGILRHTSKILTYSMIVIVALAFVVPWLMR
ncbi:MAG: site-2 protease family protein [Nitrosopumilus sp.]|nr:site-2 protease family protein [Nitrosopumilus sp.]